MAPLKSQAPVFLFCSERSGSNLISTIVGTHSEFYGLPPLHFGREVLLNFAQFRAPTFSGPAWEKAIRYVEKRLTSFVDATSAANAKAKLQSATLKTPGALAKYLYLETVPAAAGKRVFIKENNLHRLLYFILDTFPDARFVFQVRDPRDFLASTKAIHKNKNKFGTDRAALRTWREDQEGGLHALGFLGPERVFLHRYEDLLVHPNSTLENLCAFLGVSFEAEMLGFHQTDQAERLAKSNKQRSNIAQPLLVTNFAKFRSELQAKDIRQTEKKLGDLMTIFGYPFDHYQEESDVTPILPYLQYPAESQSN